MVQLRFEGTWAPLGVAHTLTAGPAPAPAPSLPPQHPPTRANSPPLKPAALAAFLSCVEASRLRSTVSPAVLIVLFTLLVRSERSGILAPHPHLHFPLHLALSTLLWPLGPTVKCHLNEQMTMVSLKKVQRHRLCLGWCWCWLAVPCFSFSFSKRLNGMRTCQWEVRPSGTCEGRVGNPRPPL